MKVLDGRSRNDLRLATGSRLRRLVDLASPFQSGVAANLVAQTRRLEWMPYLHLPLWQVIAPYPMVVLGIEQSAADLSESLREYLRKGWNLPADRTDDQPWQPPHNGWGEHYDKATRLEVHLVKAVCAQPVIVAVASVIHLEFQADQGPVLGPADTSDVQHVRQTVEQWWEQEQGGRPPDMYLVVHCPTGWAKGAKPDYDGRCLTVLAEPQGIEDWLVDPYPTDGMSPAVQNFVARLKPTTVFARLQLIRQWVEARLRDKDYLTMTEVQDEIESDIGESVELDEIDKVFEQLAKTGRYRRQEVNGKPAIGGATQQERIGHWVRRRWVGVLSTVLVVLAAIVGTVAPFVIKDDGRVALGSVVAAIVCCVGSVAMRRFARFLSQP